MNTKDWIIIKSSAGSYLGKVLATDENTVTLGPAYEYIQHNGVTPQGIVQARIIAPVDGSCSDKISLTVDKRGSVSYAFDDLHDLDKREFVKQINNVNASSTSRRTGLVLGGAGIGGVRA